MTIRGVWDALTEDIPLPVLVIGGIVLFGLIGWFGWTLAVMALEQGDPHRYGMPRPKP